MRLTPDETRALGFIALLLALSAGARLLGRPAPIETDLAEADPRALSEASRASAEEAARAAAPLAPGEKIDPNTAEVEQLMRLPRVGRALAERIVADRQENGRYRALADLDRVAGVGPATLEAWAEHIPLPREPPGGATPRPATERAARTPAARTAPARAAPASADRIELNHATAAELERVPGIGPAIAKRIIAHRQRIGRFTSVEQLVDVPGIGAATLDRIRPYVRAGG